MWILALLHLDTQQVFVLIAVTMHINPVKLVLQRHGSYSELWEIFLKKAKYSFEEGEDITRVLVQKLFSVYELFSSLGYFS